MHADDYWTCVQIRGLLHYTIQQAAIKSLSNLCSYYTPTKKKKKKVSDTEVKQLGHSSKCFPIHLDYPDVVKHPLSSFKYCLSLWEMCSSFLLLHKVHAVSSLDDQVTITPEVLWFAPCMYLSLLDSLTSWLLSWVIRAYLGCKSCFSTINQNGCQDYFWHYQLSIRTYKWPHLISSILTEQQFW